MDVLTPEQRSRNMSAIRSRGNRTTEKALRYRLIRAGVKGWTLHSVELPGKPDFVFRKQRIVIFVDGCYWHGCARCYRPPKTNRGYWSEKFKRNKARDRRVSAALRKDGWTVVRLWEHEVKKSASKVIERIRVLVTPLRGLLRHEG